VLVERTDNSASGLDLQEGGEDQGEPALHFFVGTFLHPPEPVAHQADRQGQRQLAAPGLV
jgi:hypothetical protein